MPPESNDAVNTNSSESTEPAEVETEAEAQEKKGGDSEVGIAAENVPLAVVEDGEAGATEAATDANSEAAAPSCGAEISEVKAQGEEEEREAAAVGEGGESEYAKRMASDLCIQSRKARWANRKAASKKEKAVVPPESPRPTSQNDEAASAQSLSEEFIERKLYSAVCKSPEPSAAAAPEEATTAEEQEEQPQPQEQTQQHQQPPPPHTNGKPARRRGNRGKNAVQRQNSRSEPEAAGKGAPPLVDEDGWETKSNKRKGRKGANSSRQNSIVNGNGVASQQHQQLRQRRQSSLEARDEEAARGDAAEGTPVAVADEASVPSAAEKAPSETAGEKPREPAAAEPEKEEEEKEKERDGDGEESVKSEETAAALQRRKKRNKKAYRQQGTQPLELEQQHECCNLPRVYVQDGLPGTVGPLNTKVRPATELFDAATLTEVMRRGHLDTLFVQGIGCGIGVGPLMMGRIGGGRYCPPDRAHEIPEKFREQPKEEGENGENEEAGDDDKGKEGEEEEEKKQERGEQEPEQPEEGQQPSVEIELD